MTSTEARRIAIDYTPAFEQGGGIGRYVRELTRALARLDAGNAYRLFVAGARRVRLPPPPGGNFAWKPTVLTPRWLARVWQRARLPLPVEAFTGPLDLYHATDFVLPPTRSRTRTLLTVHDLSFVRVPEAASPPLRAYLDAVVPRSVAEADRILADSIATREDLIELYGTSGDKISVLYSGVDRRFQRVDDDSVLRRARAKYGLDGVNYALSVGTIQPRKNYSRVIQALSALRQSGLDLHYAIAGASGWLEGEMRRTIEREGMKDRVRLLGFVDDADLPALYSGARALIMVSLYEGFGFPVLEAMACGAPVVASELSSLPEVGGEAALLVDPYDVAGIGKAIVQLETNERGRRKRVEAGYAQAKRFTWERAAAQLQGIYDEMLA